MKTCYRRPLKLAYFSPLPPQPSGISDYSRDLLLHLANWAEVHLFIDDYTPSEGVLAPTTHIWNYREYPWRREAHGYDCTVYQMGNNLVHRYMYPYITRFPGVVVLHDLVLHHLLLGMALDARAPGLYLREMAYAYGQAGARTARDVLVGRREPPFFEYPLCERILDVSLGVLAHSQHVVKWVREHRPDVPVLQVPMGIPLPPDPPPKSMLRRQLGLPEEAYIVASFGQATHHKRIPTVLRSVARLLSEKVNVYYVIVGNPAPDLDMEKQARELGVAHRVRVTGYVPEEVFNAYIHAVDVCVNLRYPTAGETSASALRSMAAGQPTIVSDIGANQELPDSCCIKLPVDEYEDALLAKVLQMLAARSELRAQLGSNARRYVERHHSLEQAAKSYVSFLEELVWAPKAAPLKGTAPGFDNDYLSAVAGHLDALGFHRSDNALLHRLGEALAELGLDPHKGEEGTEQYRSS